MTSDFFPEVVYEDDDILVINKPQGFVVHHGSGVDSGTLYDALVTRYPSNDTFFREECRMGIVHRLDKDTSGLMVIAKTIEAYNEFVNMFKNHSVYKEYNAICYGFFNKTEDTIETFLSRSHSDRKKFSVSRSNEGKNAITHYEVVEQYEFGKKKEQYASLLKVVIETGRTHQIRVHMSSIGHPIVNDAIYSKKKVQEVSSLGLMLMARVLIFQHPTNGEKMKFTLPYDKRFLECIECFKHIS